MAHSPDIVAKARALYVYERKSLDAVADQLGIGIATARRWKAKAELEGDDWERSRSAARLSGEGTQLIGQMILEDYLHMHQAAMSDIKSDEGVPPLVRAEVLSRLADAFNKTMAAIAKSSPELSRLSIATDVLQRLTRYVAEDHPQLAGALLEVLEPFAAELAKEYG